MATKTCPECATTFELPSVKKGQAQAFCQERCRVAYNNRMKARGQAVVALALTWRAGRGSTDAAKAAYAELCTVLDAMNAQDRAAGRPPVAQHTANVMKAGRWIDRQRS